MNIFKFSKYFFILSLFFIIYSVFYINSNNLKYGLEFSGGTEVIIDFYEEVDIEPLRERVSFISNIDSTVQLYDENNYLIKFPFDQKTEFNVKDKLSKVFKEFYSDLNPNIVQIDFIGPKVGKELVQNGLMAIIYGSIAILIYVFIRFNISFSIAAVFALFHDFLISLFFISFLNIEITLSTIAAILTVIGYSVNDTIVIFDRVRENLLNTKSEFTETINISIVQTLSRTILTVITVLIVLIPLYFFGGPILRDFSLIMIIGVIIGTYSSILFAPYLMYIFSSRRINKNG